MTRGPYEGHEGIMKNYSTSLVLIDGKKLLTFFFVMCHSYFNFVSHVFEF